MFFKRIIVAAGLAVFCQSVQASDLVGNGGDGLMRNGHLYLLDLVEAGNYLNPVMSANPPDALIVARVRAATNLEENVVQVVSGKLTELVGSNKVLSLSLLKIIEAHKWIMTDEDLQNVGDEHLFLKINPADLVQVALRRTPRIYLNRSSFQQLDIVNRAALILHEAAYAVIQPILVNGQTVQASWLARAFIGQLFSKDFSIANSRFDDDLEAILPVVLNETISQIADLQWVTEMPNVVLYSPRVLQFGCSVKNSSYESKVFNYNESKSLSKAEILAEVADFCRKLLQSDGECVKQFHVDRWWQAIQFTLRRVTDGNSFIGFTNDLHHFALPRVSYNGTETDCVEKVTGILQNEHYLAD